jgi:hypothetical protein
MNLDGDGGDGSCGFNTEGLREMEVLEAMGGICTRILVSVAEETLCPRGWAGRDG